MAIGDLQRQLDEGLIQKRTAHLDPVGHGRQVSRGGGRMAVFLHQAKKCRFVDEGGGSQTIGPSIEPALHQTRRQAGGPLRAEQNRPQPGRFIGIERRLPVPRRRQDGECGLAHPASADQSGGGPRCGAGQPRREQLDQV